MTRSILITGGTRSGKSALAERVTLNFARPAIYIATAQDFDPEMKVRIASHRERRGNDWRTIVEPYQLTQTLDETDSGSPRLVDCLTLWLSNSMLADRDWEAEIELLAETIQKQTSPVIFVTSEVGGGIVPENRLARTFRDAAGLMNQRVASVCDKLYLCVAGHPIEVK